jgi:hypothetical protein
MDLIDRRLTTDSINRKLSAPIRAAVKLSMATLNKYYTKTDLSEVYRIAMGRSVQSCYCRSSLEPLQSFTLATSSLTSRKLAGQMIG